MSVTIYHNPKCATSRKVLDALRARGLEPKIVLYLETPPSRAKIAALLKAMKARPRDILRKKGNYYKELGLDDPKVSDAALIDAMAEHPALIERPIVEGPRGTVLCRPPEKVSEAI